MVIFDILIRYFLIIFLCSIVINLIISTIKSIKCFMYAILVGTELTLDHDIANEILVHVYRACESQYSRAAVKAKPILTPSFSFVGF